nr:MAG TPA: hypothetical protein [Caudoviricetes sp.]
MILLINKWSRSRPNPQNRVRFPLVMCIYSKRANKKTF